MFFCFRSYGNMLFMNSNWKIKPPITEQIRKRFYDVNPVVLQLLVNRGLNSKKEFDEFLKPDWSKDVHDPFLIPDMEKAVGRIFEAKEKKEKVAIFGDYDADGICGVTILLNAFKRIGLEGIVTYIPHRVEEGYGININALNTLKDKGVKLIVTVDLGIGNVDEIAWARANGMDVIVIDHHEFKIGDDGIILPDAYAVIHARVPGSQYPYKYLSGAGTAFKFVQALFDHSLENHEAYEKWLLDLVAISTIADIVPILGENRTLVKYGLMVLNKTQRVGIRKLISVAKINGRGGGVISAHNHFNLDAWNVAFQIAPRINAAGRISHADNALALLTSDNDEDAEMYARDLNNINIDRQKRAENMYKEAVEQIGDVTDKYLLVAHSPEWEVGIVGLVAGKIANQHNRPTILLTSVNDMIVGSGRSIEGFDLKSGLDSVMEHLDRAGGHAMACGIRMRPENKDLFVSAFTDVVKRALSKIGNLHPTVWIDMELEFKHINREIIDVVNQFAPFGESNPTPLFVSTRLIVENIMFMGGNKQHLKLALTDEFGEAKHSAIGFFMADKWKDKLSIGEKVDIVYELGINEWNGSSEIQIKIKDLRLTNA